MTIAIKRLKNWINENPENPFSGQVLRDDESNVTIYDGAENPCFTVTRPRVLDRGGFVNVAAIDGTIIACLTTPCPGAIFRTVRAYCRADTGLDVLNRPALQAEVDDAKRRAETDSALSTSMKSRIFRASAKSRMMRAIRRYNAALAILDATACPGCDGSGTVSDSTCPGCDGTGDKETPRATRSSKIPKTRKGKRNLFADEKLLPARTWFIDACIASQGYDAALRDALDTYGGHGPTISGAGRDHFPEHVKESLRMRARRVSEYVRLAWERKPARYHDSTMRELARQCAQRHGHGFYGPRP